MGEGVIVVNTKKQVVLLDSEVMVAKSYSTHKKEVGEGRRTNGRRLRVANAVAVGITSPTFPHSKAMYFTCYVTA
jgi:hypothetical protein